LRYPEFPEPIGVFRAVEVPSYDIMLNEEIDQLTAEAGDSDLSVILKGADSWVVET
jgi:2-oxoglutarate ferredoxin oxidoreductase subunit beta